MTRRDLLIAAAAWCFAPKPGRPVETIEGVVARVEFAGEDPAVLNITVDGRTYAATPASQIAVPSNTAVSLGSVYFFTHACPTGHATHARMTVRGPSVVSASFRRRPL